MKSTNLTVRHSVGLHARPAAKFVRLAKSFHSEIRIRNLSRDGEEVDAKSLVRVIKISVAQHQEIVVTASGDDEDEAIGALGDFIREVSEEDQ